MTDPGMVAAFDQLGAACRPVASWSREFYDDLLGVGFDADQALEILVVWSEAMAWRVVGGSS